ncbi:helix-turn-helix transcriptional regulator [Ruegeria halocynthiae]|nr:PAS domain-containing protein [Ruegeria halocynthiae]
MSDIRSNATALARAIPMLFGRRAEVVLHDLETETIAYIENPFSKRKPDDPSNMQEIDFRPGDTVIGPYEKMNWDGSILRSISVVLRDEAGAAQFVLCINHDLTDLHQLSQLVHNLQPAQMASTQPDSLFRNDWHERLNVFVSGWCTQRDLRIDALDREARRDLVSALQVSNALAERNAAAYVARLLGVSRATIYNDLKTLVE